MINELIELKLSLDEEYESQSEHNDNHDPDLFIATNVSKDDWDYIESKIREMIQTIEDNDTPDGELTRYLDGDQDHSHSVRDAAVELYLSTSGHGAGFFDHSTPQGDKIQAILDEHHRYETEDWHFYQEDDNQLRFTR